MFHMPFLMLIGALTTGMMVFAPDAPPIWTWGKTSFVFFVLAAVTLFARSELKRPSLLWALYDDFYGTRIRRRVGRSLSSGDLIRR